MKESPEEMLIAIIKIGLVIYVGYLLFKALSGA